jgi:hypothetical protein
MLTRMQIEVSGEGPPRRAFTCLPASEEQLSEPKSGCISVHNLLSPSTQSSGAAISSGDQT